MAAVKQPQLAVIHADPQRLAGVHRHGTDPESPGDLGAHGLGDLAGDGLIHNLTLAHDEKPVVRGRIDGAVQFRSMLRQGIVKGNVENELFEMLEVRRERGQLFGMNMAERNHTEAHRYCSQCLCRAERSISDAFAPMVPISAAEPEIPRCTRDKLSEITPRPSPESERCAKPCPSSRRLRSWHRRGGCRAWLLPASSACSSGSGRAPRQDGIQ